ncbi:MAG: hypothetical protein U0520_04290 [Candidatus Saccharimonadales bacterium]
MAASVEISLGCSPDCAFAPVVTNDLFASEAGELTYRIDTRYAGVPVHITSAEDHDRSTRLSLRARRVPSRVCIRAACGGMVDGICPNSDLLSELSADLAVNGILKGGTNIQEVRSPFDN